MDVVNGVSSAVVGAFVATVNVAVCVVYSELWGFSNVSVVNGGKVEGVVVSVSTEVLGVRVVSAAVGVGTLVNVNVIVPAVVVGASFAVLPVRVNADAVDSAAVVSVVNLGSRVDADAYLVNDIVEGLVVDASVVVLKAILIVDEVGTAVCGSVAVATCVVDSVVMINSVI